MLIRSVTLKVMLAVGLVAPALSSANDLNGSLLSGLSLSTSDSLIVPKRELVDPAISPIMEEMVITAPRTSRRGKPIDPALERLFSTQERAKAQRRELEWLRPLARQSTQKVTLGYDPHFEFRNPALEVGQNSGIRDKKATRVLRLEF